ncbi:MAG: hypothetical protein ACTSRE_15375 [Promethearchaeota archaeon]
MKKRLFLRTSVVVILFVSVFAPLSISSAQETVDIRLKRTFGMAFGDTIQGTFTVIGTGSDNIFNLSLYFDGVEVAFADSNSLTHRFKTKNYDPGELNITIFGSDSGGNPYSSTKLVNIMTPTLSIIITAAIILLVVGAASVKYGPRIVHYFRTKKNNNRKDDPVFDET